MIRVKRILQFIFSPELIFCLFLYSGSFKAAINFPIDETLFLLGLSITQGLFILIKRKSFPQYSALAIFVYLLFATLAIASLWYTPGKYYAIEKVIDLVVTIGWAFCGPLILFRDNESLKNFFISCVAIGACMTGTLLTQLDFSSYHRFISVWGSNYLTFGRVAGLAATIVLTMFLLNGKRAKLSVLVIGVFIFGIVMSGGRMPLISFAVALFVFTAGSIKLRLHDGKLYISKGLKYLVIAGIAFFIILPYTNYTENITFKRLTLLTSEESRGASVDARTDRFSAAIEMIKEKPFLGAGIGAFPIYFDGKDERSYPHNIALEILSELGIVGLIIFSTLIFLCLNSIRRTDNPYKTVILSGALFLFLNANVTGDFNDNRIFISFLALMCTRPMLIKSSEDSSISLPIKYIPNSQGASC